MTNAVLLCYKMNCTKLCDSIRQTWQQKQSFIGCSKDTIVPTRQTTKPTTRFLFPTVRPSTKKPSIGLVPTSRPTAFILPAPTHSPPTPLIIATSSPTLHTSSNYTNNVSSSKSWPVGAIVLMVFLVFCALLFLVVGISLCFTWIPRRWRCCSKKQTDDASHAYALL